MDFISLLALSIALAWASGLNVYAVFMLLGFGSVFGLLELPSGLEFTSNPAILVIATIMFIVEFIVDKVPVADSVWDSFHTFIRVIAGAYLASSVFGGENFGFILSVGIFSALIAGSSHSLKAGTRVVANTSPEPFSNMGLSFIEDIFVFGGLFLAFKYPMAFLIFFLAYVLALIWLLPKVFMGIKKIFSFFFKRENPLHEQSFEYPDGNSVLHDNFSQDLPNIDKK